MSIHLKSLLDSWFKKYKRGKRDETVQIHQERLEIEARSSTIYTRAGLVLSQRELDVLIQEVKDYQIVNGILLKTVRREKPHTVPAVPVGVCLVPSQFPRRCYEDAVRLQNIFNELYMMIAVDESWLAEVLRDYIKTDPLTSVLWDIYLASKRDLPWPRQRLSLGVFRNDYMVHVDNLHSNKSPSAGILGEPQLRQVELNTYTVAGSVHANNVANMHRHLHRTGIYGTTFGPDPSSPSSLPPNHATAGIVRALTSAHHHYISSAHVSTSSPPTYPTAILFLVQPNNFNIADERPLEHALWSSDPNPIPTFRLIFGPDVLHHTTLHPSTGALLYQPPHLRSDTPQVYEVSVAYLRAGHQPSEYADPAGVGRAARLRIERSRAVKCPPVLGHLAGWKKVQQRLAEPGELARFGFGAEGGLELGRTFAPMYPMDGSERGLVGREIAMDEVRVRRHVLKPSLEGGGNNVYGSDIPAFLEKIPEREWHRYILMEMIESPVQRGILMSQRDLYDGPVVSELGMVGTCLWRDGEEGMEVLENECVGWTFKSKPVGVNEMSVVKGYGCFDSPWLVDV